MGSGIWGKWGQEERGEKLDLVCKKIRKIKNIPAQDQMTCQHGQKIFSQVSTLDEKLQVVNGC